MEGEFLYEFIDVYRDSPCLWNTNSPDFKNREKRKEAYQRLIEVATKYGDPYNVERVKQKINNLRCAFRNHWKKYNENKNKKGYKDELYCPKRQYLEKLSFLLNADKPDGAKVDNLKVTSITKRKVNEILKSGRELQVPKKMITITNDEVDTDYEKFIYQDDSPHILTSTVLKSPTTTTTTNIPCDSNRDLNRTLRLHSNKETPQEIDENTVVKSKSSPVVTTMQIKDTSEPVHIDLHKEEDGSLLWSSRSSSITIKKANDTQITAPMTINPITVAIPTIAPTPVICSSYTIDSTGKTIDVSFDNNNAFLNNNSNNSEKLNKSNSDENSRNIENEKNIHFDLNSLPKTLSSTAIQQYPDNCSTKQMNNCNCFGLKNPEKRLPVIYKCSTIEHEDEFNIFGKMIAGKLRSMNPQQSIIAQRLITNIAYDGQMNLLTYPPHSGVITTVESSNVPAVNQAHIVSPAITSIASNAFQSSQSHNEQTTVVVRSNNVKPPQEADEI